MKRVIVKGIVLFLVGMVFSFPAPETFLSSNEDNSCSQTIRRVKDSDGRVSLSGALEILNNNSMEADRKIYEMLRDYVGGEEALKNIISSFRIDEEKLGTPESPVVYDPNKKILRIQGESQTSEGKRYVVTFLMFIEPGSTVGEVAINIKEKKPEESSSPNLLEEIFIDFRHSRLRDIVLSGILSAVETQIGNFLRYVIDSDKLSSLPTKNLHVEVPIFSSYGINDEWEIVFRDNPVLKYLITRKKIIKDLVTEAAILTESDFSDSGGSYFTEVKAIFKKLSTSGGVPVLAHELWHHIHLNKLYNPSETIDGVFGKFVLPNATSSDIFELMTDFKVTISNIAISQRQQEGFIESIMRNHVRNIFIYMFQNHRELLPWLIEKYCLNPVIHLDTCEVLEGEAIAMLFEVFADGGQKEIESSSLEEISVKIKPTDVEIFADLGIIPDWMRPSKLGFNKEFINADYYDLVKSAQP